jgi:CheY-like chemotaxis protein
LKRAPKRILLVEDEAVTAMSMLDILEAWGYETCTPATTGAEALARVEKERPDLVLLDIKLSRGTSGIEVARKIKERFGVPILFMTGYLDEGLREKAENVGPVGYLVKPVNMEKLKSAIEKGLK